MFYLQNLTYVPKWWHAHFRLVTDMERANREGFSFGAKLVRGAYMFLERERAEKMDYQSPVFDTIQQTHDNYDRCEVFGNC